MTDEVKIVPATRDAAQKIGYIGARLREKSTYGGLAVAIGIALPFLMKYLPQLSGTNAETIVSAISDIGLGVGVLIGVFMPEKGAVNSAPPSFTPTIVKILLVAFALSFLVAGNKAEATPLPKPRLPAITGDPIADIKTDLTNAGLVPATGVTKNSDGTVVCNFNVFANLNPKNLIATINACVSDTSSTFEPDVSAALDSAKAYSGSGDQTGIQCLQPALAIVQAGIQRPAVAAVAAQPATATAPAVAAVTGVPAYSPGAITLFQKFREFTLAGGPTACQNWVNGTIQGAIAPAAGLVGAAAVTAVTGGLVP